MNDNNASSNIKRKEAHPITLTLCDKSVCFEVPLEYSFPDYQPEIRRLLNVQYEILPRGKYVGGKNVEFSGRIEYRVLYVGADGELYSLPIGTEYNYTLPIECESELELDPNGWVTAVSTPRIESLNARVTGPSKIVLKARVCAHGRVYGIAESVMDDPDVEGNLCRKVGVCNTLVPVEVYCDNITLRDTLPLTGDSRVVTADARGFLGEITKSGDRLGVKGVAEIRLLIDMGDGELSQLNRKLPFSGESEPLSQDLLTADFCGECRVSELRLDVGEQAVDITAEILPEIRGSAVAEVEYTADVYSTEYNCGNTYTTVNTPVPLVCRNANFSVNERVALSDLNIPEGASIVEVFADGNMDKCEQKGNNYRLSGSVRFSMIIKQGEEYTLSEVVFPQKYDLDGERFIESYDLRTAVISPTAVIDGNNILLGCETVLSIELFGGESPVIVKESLPGDPIEKDNCSLIICYPAKGESLWDVAKKYAVSTEAVKIGKNERFMVIEP